MRSIAYIVFALLFLGSNYELKAVDKQQMLDSFKAANEKYKAQKYFEALKTYKSVYNYGFESADLYYNMGNAYYKNDSLPMSIWCYEKALLIDPNFEEAKNNLELANLSVADKVQDLPKMALWYYWQKFKRLFTLRTWIIISVIFLWVIAAGIYLLMTQFVHWYKRMGIYLIIVGLLFSLISGTVAATNAYQLNNPKAAIVTTSNVYAKSAPEENSADLFIIHSGLKVRFEDEIGEWVKIKLADGKTGWVVKKDLKSL